MIQEKYTVNDDVGCEAEEDWKNVDLEASGILRDGKSIGIVDGGEYVQSNDDCKEYNPVVSNNEVLLELFWFWVANWCSVVVYYLLLSKAIDEIKHGECDADSDG